MRNVKWETREREAGRPGGWGAANIEYRISNREYRREEGAGKIAKGRDGHMSGVQSRTFYGLFLLASTALALALAVQAPGQGEAISLDTYGHCRGAMLARDCGKCDLAVSEFREAQYLVDHGPKPSGVSDAQWARHREEAPVIYGMAIAECYMGSGRYCEALRAYEQVGEALKSCKDACAGDCAAQCAQGRAGDCATTCGMACCANSSADSASGPTSASVCRLKADLTSKVILPMRMADCYLALSERDKARALLLSARDYLAGGKCESRLCPHCRADGYCQEAAKRVAGALALLRD